MCSWLKRTAGDHDGRAYFYAYVELNEANLLSSVTVGDQAGGPLYPIELGRRDSLTSFAENSETYLPPFNLNVSGLLENFEAAGLNLVDLVVLSGTYI